MENRYVILTLHILRFHTLEGFRFIHRELLRALNRTDRFLTALTWYKIFAQALSLTRMSLA